MDLKAIGRRIKAARENAGLTQEDLAKIIDCTPQHISAMERGLKSPRLDTFVTIANATHVSADYLLSDNLEESTAPANILSLTYSALSTDMQRRVLKIIEIMTG